MFLLSFFLTLVLTSADCSVSSSLLVLSSVEHKSETAVTCPTTITSCVSTPPLPSGLILSPICVISGKSDSVVYKKQYKIDYVTEENHFTVSVDLVVTGTLTKCDYGVTSDGISISSNQAFTIQPPRCDAPITSCSSTNMLNGVTIDPDGKIYTTGATSTVEQTEVVIACTDGTSTVDIPLKLSVGSNIGSTPLQYFQYPFTTFYLPVTVDIDVVPTNYVGIISNCESSSSFPQGLTLDPNTCSLKGTYTTIPTTTVVDIVITAGNLFSKSSTTVKFSYVEYQHEEFQEGFLIYFYKYENAQCDVNFVNQDISSAVLKYITVRDHLDWTTGKVMWPEYGWNLEQKSVFKSYNYHHLNGDRMIYIFTGGVYVHIIGNNEKEYKWNSSSNAECSASNDLVGYMGKGYLQYFMARGSGNNKQLKYELQTASGSNPTGYVGLDRISHVYNGYLEYSFMFAVYPFMTEIQENKPRNMYSSKTYTYSVYPNLPTGLKIDKTTGIITGYAEELSSILKYVVTAKSTDGKSPDLTCQLDIGIEEFTSEIQQFTCSSNSVTSFVDNKIDSITCTTTTADEEIKYHSVNLPTGITLSDNGIISGTPTEIISKHNSKIYGYTINGVSEFEIEFNIQSECDFNLIVIKYTLESEGSILTLKQNDKVFFKSEDIIGVEQTGKACIEDTTSSMIFSINSNAQNGGKFTVFLGYDFLLYTDKIKDGNDIRDITINFPGNEKPEITYPDVGNLIVGFTYYIAPSSIKNGAKTFTGGMDLIGLKFDTKTGVFYGKVTSTVSNYAFHIHASNDYGTSDEVVFVLNSKFCKDTGNNKQFFTLQANIDESDKNTASIEISKSDGTTIFTATNMDSKTYEQPFCDSVGNYKAKYTFSSLSSAKIVTDSSDTITNFIPGTESEMDFFVSYNALNVMIYYYSNEYKEDWRTSTNIVGLPMVVVSNFGNYKTTTIYYKTLFKTSIVDLSSAIIMKLTYAGGIAVHINNNLIYINNLPDNYTSDSESIGSTNTQTIQLPYLQSLLKTDDTENILSIEVHVKSSMIGTADKTKVDMFYLGVNSCIKILSVNDVKVLAFAEIPGKVSDSTLGEFQLTGAFADTLYDSSNKFYYDLSSYNAYGNTWFKYRYNMPTIVNYYSIKALEANFNRYPLDWDVLASNDDSNWEVLQSIRRSAEPRENEDMSYYITNTNAYKYYWFNITSRGTDDNGLAANYRVGGIRPYYCNYPKTCEGDIPIGTFRYLTCPNGQQSPERTAASEPVRIIRECKNVAGVPTLQEDIGNTCTKERFWFDLSDNKVIGFVGKEVPTYRAFLSVDESTTTTITSDPALPSGIKIDQLSGRIYGKTMEETKETLYTITAKNDAYPDGYKTISKIITLEIKMSKCAATDDNIWPETEINKVVNITCGEEYFGTMTRECKLDDNGNAVWSEPDKTECKAKSQTNCFYNQNEYFFEFNDEVDIQCSCESIPKDVKFEPSLPDGWKYYNTGAIMGIVQNEFDIEYTITFTSSDGFIQVLQLRISSFPALESCTYGFDNEELKLYKMNVEIDGPKCVGYFNSISISSSTPLPDGLVFDNKTGGITGFMNSEIPVEGTTVIIIVKGTKNSIEIPLKFKRNNENNLLQGFRAVATVPYTASEFTKSLWNEILLGSKNIEGGATIMKKSVYPEATNNCADFAKCQSTAVRAEGYLKISEAGNYVISYKVDDNGNIVIPGFKDIRTPTANYYDIKTATVSLKSGYVYTGLFLGFNAGAYSVTIKIKKESEPDSSLVDMSSMMFRGGFIIQHVSYSSESFVIKVGDNLKLIPSYSGVPTKWKISPALNVLTLNEITGIIEGSVTECSGISKDQFTVTAYSDDGLASSSTTLKLICIDDQTEILKGLDLSVYSVDSPIIDSFMDPTIASGLYKTIETVGYPNHERSDDLWDGFSVVNIYSFIADYNGFIKINQTGDYIITMKCYDYCRLYLESQGNMIEKTGEGYGIRTLNVNFAESKYYPIRITYTKGTNDITKQLEVNIVSTTLEIESQPIDKFLYHNPKTNIQYETSLLTMYKGTSMKKNILIPYQIDISNATFKVSPTLPTGVLIENGIISGNPSIVVGKKTYTITATLSNNQIEKISFTLEVLSNEKSEIIYPQLITASSGETINVGPTNKTNCIGFTVDELPPGISINSRTGIINGIGMSAYEKDVTITCLSPNPNPVTTSIRISIAGCPSGKSFFTFGYYIYSNPKDVSFEITYGNGMKIFPPEDYDIKVPEANTYYSYGSCITTQQTYTLNIKCKSIGGYIKFFYGPLLFKYLEFVEDLTYKFQLTDHSNEAPVFTYPNENKLVFIKNLKTTFSPVLVYNGANEYNFVGSLPNGVLFDSETGALSGIATSIDSSMTLKVVATNSFGDSEEVEVEISVIECPYERVKISFLIYNGKFKSYTEDEFPYKLYYTLSNSERYVADEIATERDYSNSYCLESASYVLTIGNKENTHKWNYSEIFVKMLDDEDNEETIVRDYYRGDKEYGNVINVNIRTYIKPTTKWSYSDTPQTSDSWKDGKLSGDVFEGIRFNDLTTTTRYYVTQFDLGEIDSVANIASFIMNLKFEGGMILFINGYEYYRYNLVEGDIDSDTIPIANNELKNRKIKGPVSLFNIGINTIAIEIHRTLSEDSKVDNFVGKYLYITSGKDNCINDEYEFVTITGNHRDKEAIEYYNQGADKMADGDLTTKMFMSGAFTDTYLLFDFTEDYYQYYNSYMYRGVDYKVTTPTREIYKYSIYAIDGEGDDHKYLIGSNNVKYDESLKRESPSTISKNVPLKPMKSMRIEFVTDTNGGEITDLLPAICNNMCLKEGKWSPAYIGTTSKINCGFGTDAADERECLDDNGSPVWGNSTYICSKTCYDEEYGVGVPGGESKKSNCEYGYNGYTYRYCPMVEPVEYSEIKKDKCVGWYPSSVIYPSVEGYVGKTSIIIKPSVQLDDQLVLAYTIKSDADELPTGLTLDPTTGEITGMLDENATPKTYHMIIEIVGTQTVESEFDIVVKALQCPIDSGFPASPVSNEPVEISCEGESETKKKRICSFDDILGVPKWGVIDASACESTVKPVVKYEDEGKMVFTIDVQSYSKTPVKTDVTELKIDNSDDLKDIYGLTFDIATGQVYGKCTKEASEVEYKVTPLNGNTEGDSVTISITCKYGKPESVLYKRSEIIAYIDGETVTITPVVVGYVTSFEIIPDTELDVTGIDFNNQTGVITINAKSDLVMKDYSIKACNKDGCSSSTIISIDLRYKKPESVSYPQKEYKYTIGATVEISPESVQQNVEYEITPEVTLTDAGLKFDRKSGIISGITQGIISNKDFTLKAYNRDGETMFTFSLAIGYAAPTSIEYAESDIVIYAGEYITIPSPNVDSNDPNLKFKIDPTLPADLYLTSSGGIEGKLADLSDRTSYTVTVSNDIGEKSTTIYLKGIWPAPSVLEYSEPDISIKLGETYKSQIPTKSDHIISITSDPELPSPFVIDRETGIISTTEAVNSLIKKSSYTIIASNEAGSYKTTITIAVTNPPPEIGNYNVDSAKFIVGVSNSIDGPSVIEGSVVEKFLMNPDTLQKITNCGLIFNELDGSISGSATSPLESTQAVVYAMNDGGTSNSVHIVIRIANAPPTKLIYGDNNKMKLYIGVSNNVGPSDYDISIIKFTYVDDSKCLSSNNVLFLEESGTFIGSPSKTFTCEIEVTGCNVESECIKVQVSINCVNPPPGSLAYESQTMKAIIGEEFSSGIPIASGLVLSIKKGDNFPAEFELNEKTGEITGKGYTTRIYPSEKFTVFSSNSEGDTPTELSLSVIYPKPTYVKYTDSNYTFTQTEYSETSVAETDAQYIIEYSYTPMTLTSYGLEFDKTTGKISGSATKYSATPLTYTITATNANGTATTQIKIYMVYPAPKKVEYKNPDMVFTMGRNTVSEKPIVTGTATRYEIDPDISLYGLKFDTKTGQISGNSEIELKKTKFTVSAINEKGSAKTDITISINYPKPTKLAYASESMKFKYNENTLYVAVINADKYTTGFTVTIEPKLPEGLEIDEKTGALQGIATVLDEKGRLYTVTATNSGGSISTNVTISVIRPLVTNWKYNIPTKPNSPYTLLVNYGENFDSGLPTYESEYDSLEITNILVLQQEGFTVDNVTGRITGYAKNNNLEIKFNIYVKNSGGSQPFSFTLNIYFALPKSLTYTNPLVAILNQPIEPANPTLDGEMQTSFTFNTYSFYFPGLTISQKGVITGTATTEYKKVQEITYGNYDRGYVKFDLTIISTKPSCLPEGKWPVANYDSVAAIICEDPQIGFKTRYCHKNNVTGVGEWGEEIDGCVESTPIPEVETGKVVFNLTLQGTNYDQYKEEEVVAIAEIVVNMINNPEVNITDIAIVLYDETNLNQTDLIRLLQVRKVRAEIRVTSPIDVAKDVQNTVATLSEAGDKILEYFSSSPNAVLKSIQFAELSRGILIVKDNSGDDSDSDSNTTLYIIIGVVCAVVVIIAIVVVVLCYCRSRKNNSSGSPPEGMKVAKTDIKV